MENQTTRYTVNPDGTVTDHLMKLQWTQATVAIGIEYSDIEKEIAKLGEGWRVPTVHEQFSLVDHTRVGPAIDTDIFPDTKERAYWTSTPYAGDPSSAVWVVYFGDGDVFDYGRGNDACLRACRSLPASQ